MSALFYISLFLVLVAVIRLLIALLNYLARPILPIAKPKGNPLVSILIPARNEEKNIGNLLTDLQEQSYQNIEIIVYNDLSEDKTRTIVKEFSQTDSRVRLVDGNELPKGWLGKNHGCHNLANTAKGDFFLFLDADVRISPFLVNHAVAYMQKRGLALLSMFPRQVQRTFGEGMIVPAMNWILLSLLWLPLIRWSSWTSFSAANGQMMLFDAEIYRENLWHQKCKNSAVEDIDICRKAKQAGYRVSTLLGSDDISCRMYESYNQAIGGFTKNVTAFFGNSIFVMLFFVIIGTAGPFIVVLTLPFPLAFVYLFALIGARMLVAKLSSQSIITNTFLWPLQHFAFLHLVYSALVYRWKKNLSWKGRKIKT